MKVAMIQNHFCVGGAERVFVDLAFCLRTLHNHTVFSVVLFPTAPQEVRNWMWWEDNWDGVVALDELDDEGKCRVFQEFLDTEHPDVVMMSNTPIALRTWLKPSLRERGIPFVELWHSVDGWVVHHPDCQTLLPDREDCDHTVAVSRGLGNFLERATKSSSVTTIYTGVHTGKFEPAPKPDSDGLVVGTCCRVSWEKNLEQFIRVADMFGYSTAQITFLVVGGVNQWGLPYAEQKLIDTFKAHPRARVKTTGYVDDPVSWYQKMDVYVCCSVTEGLPVTILEALACGVPVVSTDVGGIAEVVSPEVGTIVPLRCSDEQLGDAILHVLGDKDRRRHMSAQARLLVERRFTLERMGANYLKLLEKVI